MNYVFRGSALPEHLKVSIDAFARDGRPTGSFLRACITNDLRAAFMRADEESLRAIPAIVGYLYNECDLRCWGSERAHDEWIERKRKEKAEVSA